MHTYLKSIGFSQITNRVQLDGLLAEVRKNAGMKSDVEQENGSTLVEYSLDFASNVGITVLGEYDKSGTFHFIHYFPYLRGLNESAREDISISRRIDTDTYTGMSDDLRLGIALIFFLQNTVDYLKYSANAKAVKDKSILLSALGLEGKIILPTQKNERDIQTIKEDFKHKQRLLAEAKKGSQEAMETLTIEDMDQYASITRRLKREDVFSIVETSFMPCGSESDIYNVVGTINSLYIDTNRASGEKIYVMQICCNNLMFDMCVNANSVIGTPLVGMRFRGTVWLQAHVEFV